MNRATLVYQCYREQQKRLAEIEIANDGFRQAGLPIFEHDQIEKQVLDKHARMWKKLAEINDVLTETLMEHKGFTKTNWYWITVRPKPSITFKDFIYGVDKFIHRACIITYKLTLEQKDPEGSGQGFHMHCVVDAKWKSFKEALRDTSSSFNKYAEANCIEVKTTRNPHDLFQRYCIDYEHKDGHKECTQRGDALWREKYNIEDYYHTGSNDFDALSIKSDMTEQKSIIPLTNFIIELN